MGVKIDPPNWNKKPDYSKPLPKFNDAGKIPPRTQIKPAGKDQPAATMPRKLSF